MSFRSQAERELQFFDCYRSIIDDDVADLEVTLSFSLHAIDERLLSSMCRRASKGISFVLKGAMSLPQSSVAIIVKHVSPKLKKITVNDCSNISWTDIKPILAAADYVEVLDLRRNIWVDDYVIEQLAIKFAKSMRALLLENSDLSDASLFHVGRRCLKLRHINFDCCYKVFHLRVIALIVQYDAGINDRSFPSYSVTQVSNLGLKELSKKLHLSNIVINHNSLCSDKGVELLIFSSHNLKALSLANCPALSNRVVNALYEAEVAWGKKRNTKSLPLRSLNLNGNPNFTSEIMLLISTANPELMALDITECANIDLNKALREIENLKKLEELKFGPSHCKPVDTDEFLQVWKFNKASTLQTS